MGDVALSIPPIIENVMVHCDGETLRSLITVNKATARTWQESAIVPLSLISPPLEASPPPSLTVTQLHAYAQCRMAMMFPMHALYRRIVTSDEWAADVEDGEPPHHVWDLDSLRDADRLSVYRRCLAVVQRWSLLRSGSMGNDRVEQSILDYGLWQLLGPRDGEREVEPPLPLLGSTLRMSCLAWRWRSVVGTFGRCRLRFRQKHVQLTVSEDTVAVFGGEEYSFEPNPPMDDWTLLRFDPHTRSTVETTSAPMPVARSRHAGACYDGKCYLWGGNYLYNVTCMDDDLAVLDLATHTWSTVSPTGSARPSPRASMAYTQLGRFLYVWGGRERERHFNDLWRLDLASLEWTELVSGRERSYRTIHRSAVAQEVDDVSQIPVHLPGEPGQGAAVGVCRCEGCAWTAHVNRTRDQYAEPVGASPAGVPSPRSCGSLVALPGDRLALVGGGEWLESGDTDRAHWNRVFTNVWTFDLRALEWTLLPTRGQRPTASTSICAFSDGHFIYVHGGGRASAGHRVCSDFSIFDSLTCTWLLLSGNSRYGAPGPRDGHTASKLGDMWIVTGGYMNEEVYCLDLMYP